MDFFFFGGGGGVFFCVILKHAVLDSPTRVYLLLSSPWESTCDLTGSWAAAWILFSCEAAAVLHIHLSQCSEAAGVSPDQRSGMTDQLNRLQRLQGFLQPVLVWLETLWTPAPINGQHSYLRAISWPGFSLPPMASVWTCTGSRTPSVLVLKSVQISPGLSMGPCRLQNPLCGGSGARTGVSQPQLRPVPAPEPPLGSRLMFLVDEPGFDVFV